MSLIDCDIRGISSLLNKIGQDRLQQLIIIFNNEIENFEDDEGSSIYEQLMFSNLQNFRQLRYFEFSIYNETIEPSMNCEEILSILRVLPKDIKEVCIYTSDECKNISEFV